MSAIGSEAVIQIRTLVYANDPKPTVWNARRTTPLATTLEF